MNTSAAADATTPRRPGRAIVAGLIALFVAFGACEVAARMIFPAPPNRTRQPPLAYVIDPEIRYVLLPNQQGWIDDGLVTVNAAGFRSTRQTDVPKPPGRFRIVTLGDSVAIGMGVADNETFSAQTEALLRQQFPGKDLEVVNLGVPGYDTRQEVGLLHRHLTELNPNLVLVGFYSNDVPDILDGDAMSGGTQIAGAASRTGQILHMDSTSPSWADRYLRRSRIVFIAGRTFNRLRGAGEAGMARLAMELDMLQGKRTPQLDRAWTRVDAQFRLLQQMAQSTPFDVVVVALPPRELVMGQFSSAAYVSQIRTVAEPLGFSVVDPAPAMAAKRSDRDGLYIPYDRNHPDALGHRVIAEAIAASIRDRVAR
ncbi:MAG TPA: SGNH/GDSL hydrolase family protein [Vicinamibacterales bacterium]|nr:SGNH/GDSL hydrolase family protein [Vicinamibacterales bacterium]